MKRLFPMITPVALAFALTLTTPVFAQKQLQDNFWLEKSWSNGFSLVNASYGIAVDFSNRCYVANGSSIYVYNNNGSVITNWTVASVRDVAFDPVSNLVFACSATTANQIRVYDSNFNQVAIWGTNSLSTPYGISIGYDGLVYIADYGNNRIQVFTRNGTWTNQWGQTGSAGREFRSPLHLATGPDGSVYVADYNNRRIQRFDSSGDYIGQYGPVTSWNPRAVTVAPDGLISAYPDYSSSVQLHSSDLTLLFSLASGASVYVQGITFSPDGQRLHVLTQNDVRVFRRGYRTMGLKTPNALPLPVVLSCTQRPGTTWVDVDFAVTDPDNTNVAVAAIAFRDGRTDLGGAIPMNSFTNGTEVLLPTNVATGVKHHITWDADKDFKTNYFNVKINILAKDNRGLMDFHFLTISNNIPDTSYPNSLTISRTPVTQADLLGMWVWLLARGDTNVILQTGGNVYGTGNNSNTLYAYTQISGTSTTTLTTASGRGFLFSLAGVSEASSNDLYRAKIGTTGRVTQWTPRNQIGGLPQKVNEYGFDTGLFSTSNLAANPTNVWWVVPVSSP